MRRMGCNNISVIDRSKQEPLRKLRKDYTKEQEYLLTSKLNDFKRALLSGMQQNIVKNKKETKTRNIDDSNKNSLFKFN